MDLNELMKNAASLKSKMEELKKEMSSWRISGEAGGGMVKVTMDGNGKLVKLELSDELLQEEKQVQESLIKSAVNLTAQKVKQELEDKQKEAMGLPPGLDIPL